MRIIQLECGPVRLKAQMLGTPTAEVVWRALPLHSTALSWGRLFRIDVPLEIYREPDARSVLEPGELGFLSGEDDIVIGYGRTPISKRGEIRLWGDANVFARSLDNPEALRDIANGSMISIERMVKRQQRKSPTKP